MESILIVDDEDIVRQGFISRLEYLDIKPKETLQAATAAQAIELIHKNHPKIVVTDISMPTINGIELIKTIKPLYPDIRFIILSGYAEFAYAEQALQLGVSAYLLKPISNQELKEVLINVDNQIKEQEALHSNLAKSEHFRKRYEDLNMEQQLMQLLHCSPENVPLYAGESFPFALYYTRLSIINIDSTTYQRGSFSFQDIDLLKFCIKNTIFYMDTPLIKNSFQNNTNISQLFIVLSHHNRNIMEMYSESFLNEMHRQLDQQLSISTTIGVSEIMDCLSKNCLDHAMEAYGQRVTHGTGEIHYYDNLILLQSNLIPQAELGLLQKYIERCDIGNIDIILKDIFNEANLKNSPPQYIRIIWIRIINILLRIAGKMYPEQMQTLDRSVLGTDIIDRFSSIDDLVKYLNGLIIDCLHLESMADLNSRNKILLAMQFIESHYNEDITINSLAYQYAMSPNYFSATFKRETGSNVINYITKKRMDTACNLLSKTDNNVVQIAQKVGYSDTQYFFRIFKKATGLTPLQYRKEKRDEK